MAYKIVTNDSFEQKMDELIRRIGSSNGNTGGNTGSSADVGEIQFCCVSSSAVDTPRGGLLNVDIGSIFVGTPVVGERILFQNGFGLITSIGSTSVSCTVEQITRIHLNGVMRQGFTSFYAPTDVGTSGQILQSNGTGKAPTWVNPDTIGTGGGSSSTKGYTWSSTWDSSAILVEVSTVDSTFVVPVDSYGSVDAYVSSTSIDKKMWYSEKYDDKGNYKGEIYDSGANEVYLYTYRITGNCPSLHAIRNTFIISKDTYVETDHFEPGGYKMVLNEFGAWLTIYNKKYLVKEK